MAAPTASLPIDLRAARAPRAARPVWCWPSHPRWPSPRAGRSSSRCSRRAGRSAPRCSCAWGSPGSILVARALPRDAPAAGVPAPALEAHPRLRSHARARLPALLLLGDAADAGRRGAAHPVPRAGHARRVRLAAHAQGAVARSCCGGRPSRSSASFWSSTSRARRSICSAPCSPSRAAVCVCAYFVISERAGDDLPPLALAAGGLLDRRDHHGGPVPDRHHALHGAGRVGRARGRRGAVVRAAAVGRRRSRRRSATRSASWPCRASGRASRRSSGCRRCCSRSGSPGSSSPRFRRPIQFAGGALILVGVVLVRADAQSPAARAERLCS